MRPYLKIKSKKKVEDAVRWQSASSMAKAQGSVPHSTPNTHQTEMLKLSQVVSAGPTISYDPKIMDIHLIFLPPLKSKRETLRPSL